MAKKKSTKKVSKNDSCKIDECNCNKFMIRIGAMAFILFIVTVWSSVGEWLTNVPWWVYLIIWILFCGAAMGTRNKCWCCKK